MRSFCIFLKFFISLQQYYERLEEDLFNSLEKIHCDQARWEIRLIQTRLNTPPNFYHPPPISLFHIHNRLYFERLINIKLQEMVSKAKEQHTRVEQKIIPLLSALPKEFINIVFNWTVEDMEDMEDKETILILSQWRDEHFYGNEE